MGCDKASYGPHNIGDTNRGCKVYIFLTFLSDPGVPGVRSMGPDVTHSVSPRGFADFKLITDVTLADEDSNSIPTDDVNGQSQAMWQCKWRHLVANIETNAS